MLGGEGSDAGVNARSLPVKFSLSAFQNVSQFG